MNSIETYVKMLFKPTLREACRRQYGEKFVKHYDELNSGIPMGNLRETIEFIDMVEQVRAKQ